MSGTLCGLLQNLAQGEPPGAGLVAGCWDRGWGIAGPGPDPAWGGCAASQRVCRPAQWHSCSLPGTRTRPQLMKLVQQRLICSEDRKCSAGTKYDCDHYLALEESFP